MTGSAAAAAGDAPTTVKATPKVPKHRASASAPFTKRRELTTNVSSQPLGHRNPPLGLSASSLHTSPLVAWNEPPLRSPHPPPPIRRIRTVSHHLHTVNAGLRAVSTTRWRACWQRRLCEIPPRIIARRCPPERLKLTQRCE